MATAGWTKEENADGNEKCRLLANLKSHAA
jgi:hypothetical protein